MGRLSENRIQAMSKIYTVGPEVERAMALVKRGCNELLVESEFAQKLARSEATGMPLRCKLGLDATAPDLHLGHTVVLNKLRQLQDLGHTVIFLIGDFTALIGDPSGRNTTRPPLSRDQIEENAKTYFDQAGLVLLRDKTEIRYNSEWSEPLGAAGMIKLAAHYTLARLLERDDFATRYRENTPIAMHELLYPLMQGYDSVALESDIELGGTDQRFNLLVGREIAASLRPGAAMHPDDAAARRARRRREDVEKQKQLHRHHGAGVRHVLEDDVDLGRADVALVRPAVAALERRDRRAEATDDAKGETRATSNVCWQKKS